MHSHAPLRNGQLRRFVSQLSFLALWNGISLMGPMRTFYSVGFCLDEESLLLRLHEGPRKF